ncbi:MAG: 4Fe-4S binding protein [Clostridia bacterium]
MISKDSLETEGAIAQVSEQDCTGCGTCEKVCAYKAITMEEIQQRNGTRQKGQHQSRPVQGLWNLFRRLPVWSHRCEWLCRQAGLERDRISFENGIRGPG